MDEETLAKAKDLLAAETGTDSEPDSVEEPIIEKEDMKIVKTVRFLLTRLLQGGHLTDDEIKSMTDEEYSKNTFNINFQVLKTVDENTLIEEQKRDHRGYNR